jgi:hypothetical protein
MRFAGRMEEPMHCKTSNCSSLRFTKLAKNTGVAGSSVNRSYYYHKVFSWRRIQIHDPARSVSFTTRGGYRGCGTEKAIVCQGMQGGRPLGALALVYPTIMGSIGSTLEVRAMEELGGYQAD